MAAQHSGAAEDEEQRRSQAGKDWGEEPGDNDGHDALQGGEASGK